jgi:hypothetical protein
MGNVHILIKPLRPGCGRFFTGTPRFYNFTKEATASFVFLPLRPFAPLSFYLCYSFALAQP